jgi:predicted O-methyltransferase YrrM
LDVAAFAAELPMRFGGDLYADHPPERRYRDVVDEVPGMSTEHALTVLDLAVRHLADDECYLEVGSYRGRSLVGAMIENPERRAVAVESFSEFGVDAAETLSEVQRTLADHGCSDRVQFIVGDAFRLFRPGFTERPVGAYFYDGAHSRVAQYLGLAMAESLLADEALVMIDDATWPQVAAATRSYLARHEGYEVVADLRAAHDFDPRWCNGMLILAWRRPPGWKAPSGWAITWRKAAHRVVLEPTRRIAWRVLGPRPRLMAFAKRIYLHGGTAVQGRS